jgi:hypothetical protein
MKTGSRTEIKTGRSIKTDRRTQRKREPYQEGKME